MSKKIGIPIGIAVVAALIIGFMPLKTIAYTVTVDYQDTETYYEDELREVIEPLEYQVTQYGGGGGPHYTLINRDSVAGYFDICCTLYIMDEDTYDELKWQYGRIPIDVFKQHSQQYILKDRVYLEPGEKGGVKWSWDDITSSEFRSYESFWDISPEQVTKTTYVQVEKKRTVTKQRPETRCKKVTVLDYLLNYT
jgi:hypothetical protein